MTAPRPVRTSKRSEIPPEMAARVLFASDRTCCLCRDHGKPIQIHHIDGDPSNHELTNLAVLCLDHHRDTQLRGGFDRKLDTHQVVLYRDDWHRLVASRRAAGDAVNQSAPKSTELEVATSVADALLEAGQYELLAYHFDELGNDRLRDKYIELALERNASDSSIFHLRALQGRHDLIPDEVAKRHLAVYDEYGDWLQRARALRKLGRHRDAVADYLRGIGETLDEQNTFSAAFYLKELAESGLIDELFVIAFREASEEGDLWWQVRALQELGWDKELADLLLRNGDEIENSGDSMLLMLLADVRGDERQAVELRTRIFGSLRLAGGEDGSDSESDLAADSKEEKQ